MNVPTEETATPARSPLMSVAAWLAAPALMRQPWPQTLCCKAAGSEGHCAKTCQSRLDRRHTSGQDQPGGQRSLANAAASALPHLINRNTHHAR